MRKVVSPGGATKPAATFKVGDKVVLYPTAVMSITAIGPNRVAQTGPVRALAGDAKVQPVADDAVAYALRFIGADRDAFAVDVKATTRPPMRHLSTPAEIATFSRSSATPAGCACPGATAEIAKSSTAPAMIS